MSILFKGLHTIELNNLKNSIPSGIISLNSMIYFCVGDLLRKCKWWDFEQKVGFWSRYFTFSPSWPSSTIFLGLSCFYFCVCVCWKSQIGSLGSGEEKNSKQFWTKLLCSIRYWTFCTSYHSMTLADLRKTTSYMQTLVVRKNWY